jgi:hypothetical protein
MYGYVTWSINYINDIMNINDNRKKQKQMRKALKFIFLTHTVRLAATENK